MFESWKVPFDINERELKLLALSRKQKLWGFLREYRHQLLDADTRAALVGCTRMAVGAWPLHQSAWLWPCFSRSPSRSPTTRFRSSQPSIGVGVWFWIVSTRRLTRPVLGEDSVRRIKSGPPRVVLPGSGLKSQFDQGAEGSDCDRR